MDARKISASLCNAALCSVLMHWKGMAGCGFSSALMRSLAAWAALSAEDNFGMGTWGKNLIVSMIRQPMFWGDILCSIGNALRQGQCRILVCHAVQMFFCCLT